ncbi:hypothetical protein [Azospirillum brasilense]|uniref:hypothetical protein n=1 Tax=Azospirillum brasilense TaxID=192 RepID=UPI0013B3D01B|nr:hypothetical protein [Azospirillum brasilense]
MTRILTIASAAIVVLWLPEGRLQAADALNVETCEPQPDCRLLFSTKSPGVHGRGITSRGLSDAPSPTGTAKLGGNTLEQTSPSTQDMLKNAKPDTYRLPSIDSMQKKMQMQTR